MSNPVAIEASRNGKRRAIEKVYEYMTLHEGKATSDGDLAERFRIPKQDIRNLRYDLVEIGSLKLTTVLTSGSRGIAGKKIEWTLIEPLNVSKARLEAKWRKDDQHTADLLRKPNPSKAGRRKRAPGEGWTNGAQATLGDATPDHPVVPDQLVASAGPEASKPLAQSLASARYDEPRALVEAARQYATVNKQLDDKVKELEALGMNVDRSQLAKAIKAPHDHQLLVVSKVMPYIEGLERRVERLEAQNVDLREKAGRTAEVEQINTRLSEQNRRLVSELQGYRTNGKAAPAPAPKGDAPQPVG
jgi:hypothetical protein